jgi:phosphoglycolate phosphatase
MSTPKLQAVLFDLDGTLLDTAPDFVVVVNQLRNQYDLPNLDSDLIRATVSHGARALITLAFGLQEGEKDFEILRQQLLTRYSQHLDVETRPFDGIPALLNWLENSNILWGIVTNKPRLYAEPILQSLKLSERCHTLICPDDVSKTKPHPEPMHLACQQLSITEQQTLYIGDHRRDIEAGKNANMRTIAANYGYIDANDPADQWHADFIVNHANEIKPLLQTHFAL